MSEHLVTDFPKAVVAEQFEDRHQQKEAATLGMWTFLATEILFFGGLFVTYTIYRHRWTDAFREGSLDLKWYFGGVNTAVLLLSSFSMAMAVRAAAQGSNPKIIRYLALTFVVAAVFLGIKATEYYVEYRERLVPGYNFTLTRPTEKETGALVGALDDFEHWFQNNIAHSPERAPQRSRGEEMFMFFYFVMTAIHATHMVIGMVIMLVLIEMSRRRVFSADYHNPVEMFGLYWHFVDIVWVFLFPTLYLLRNP
jgi:cytochrome c oxidase subunit 3